jgi:hypothetical protein
MAVLVLHHVAGPWPLFYVVILQVGLTKPAHWHLLDLAYWCIRSADTSPLGCFICLFLQSPGLGQYGFCLPNVGFCCGSMYCVYNALQQVQVSVVFHVLQVSVFFHVLQLWGAIAFLMPRN